MIIKFKEYFIKFKELSENIMIAVKEEDFDEVESIINERQKVIEDIMSLNLDKDQFLQLCEEYEIFTVHEKLQNCMNGKKVEFKNELLKINKNRQAYNTYNKSAHNSSFFIKQKI